MAISSLPRLTSAATWQAPLLIGLLRLGLLSSLGAGSSSGSACERPYDLGDAQGRSGDPRQGLTKAAETLEALAPMRTDADFTAAQPALNKASEEASAAWSAAWSAAADVFKLTTAGLQASAVLLIQRMCAVGRK